MFGLTNPWVLLGLLVLLTATAATSFVSGMEWEQGQQAQRRVISVDRILERTRTIIRRDNAAVQAAQQRTAALQAENERLQEEARRHAETIADPVAGHLRLERVLNIRRAWGVDADPAEPQGAVRGPEPGSVPVER